MKNICKNVCIGMVGKVYDKYDSLIGKLLVASNYDRPAIQYLFLHSPGDDNFWASASTIEECNPSSDILECFTNRIKVVIDIVKGGEVDWEPRFGYVSKGAKVSKITFWYSKCQKGIYRLVEVEL